MQFVPATESSGKGWPATITMVKLNDHWKLGLRNTKGLFLYMFNHDFKISSHVHENNQKMNLGSVRVVGREAHIHEQLFLEAWLSIKGSSIWKWPHCHPRSLLVGTYILSLVLRFLENSVSIFFSTCPTCWFLNCGYQHYISINEGLLAPAKMSWTKYQLK